MHELMLHFSDIAGLVGMGTFIAITLYGMVIMALRLLSAGYKV